MTLVALLSLVANACTPSALLNTVASDQGFLSANDVAYGAGTRNRLDVYAPKNSDAPGDHPVVVFFYGGGWESGDRNLYHFLGAQLASRGVVTVIPDYRVYPEVTFPAFMHDAAQAVAWAERNAVAFGGNPRRLFVMGHSAGAQIATLLALNGAYLRTEGLDPAALAGVIGLAGPYDFLPLQDATLKAIFGPESQWPDSQPIGFVRPGAPPMLLVTGGDDDTVDPGNTQRLATRLRAAGDHVTETIYPAIGHKILIGAFATPLTFLAPVRRDVLDFIANPTATAAADQGGG